jgi:hypothetical protein
MLIMNHSLFIVYAQIEKDQDTDQRKIGANFEKQSENTGWTSS